MENLLRDNELLLDELAARAMESILLKKAPANIEESKSIAKASYGMALAMLDVKRRLPTIAMSLPVLMDEQKKVRKNRPSQK